MQPAARSARPSCPPTRSPDRKHGAAHYEDVSAFRPILAAPDKAGGRDPGGRSGPGRGRHDGGPAGRERRDRRGGRLVRTAGAPAGGHAGRVLVGAPRVRALLHALAAAGCRQPFDRRRGYRQRRQARGWGARQLESAYKLPVNRNAHQTVAVTIAYHTPHLAHYLAVYRKEYGLPACTSAGGCFRVVNQKGRTSPLPSSGAGSGWDLEITLDVSMISAACPHCHILVVEANQPSLTDLGKAEDTAATLGAQVISNSYGVREDGYSYSLSHYYEHPGHTIVASAGDFGFTAASWPANLGSVTAVGGTELHKAKNGRGWSETTWNNALGAGGSGCSAYAPRPAWQPITDCPMRTVSDVSAAADNLAVNDQARKGWLIGRHQRRHPPDRRRLRPGRQRHDGQAPASSTTTPRRCST